MNNLKEAEKAYFAGLFDGEGYVGAYLRGGGEHLTVSIVMTNEPIVRLLYETFEGHLYPKQTPAGCKDAWQWVLTAKEEQLRFLGVINTYVRVKEEHVAVALAFLKTVYTNGKQHNMSDTEFVVRHVLTERLKVLNKRGVEE